MGERSDKGETTIQQYKHKLHSVDKKNQLDVTFLYSLFLF